MNMQAGALYHVTTRGNAQQDIYLDDEDREQFLAVLAQYLTFYNQVRPHRALEGHTPEDIYNLPTRHVATSASFARYHL
jgi:transposase InsO family protein